MPTNSQEPLLQHGGHHQGGSSEDYEAAEQLESGLSDPPKDFQARAPCTLVLLGLLTESSPAFCPSNDEFDLSSF
jgi:hypothetical protein